MKNFELNEKIMNDVYKNTHIALQSISNLLPKVKHTDIKKELTNEYEGYEKIMNKINDYMKRKKMKRIDINFFKKAMLYCAIKGKTLFGVSKYKVAEMMIQGTVMGLISLISIRNSNLEKLDGECVEIIDELTKLEGRYEENLKSFL